MVDTPQTAAEVIAAYEKSDSYSKITTRLLAGVLALIDSKLARETKYDALRLLVERFARELDIDTLDRITRCNEETTAPLPIIMLGMLEAASSKMPELERQIANIMVLFREELEQRGKLQ